MNYFITGTDTGVGKTFVTALLTRSLREAGLDTVAMKPICCGDRRDVEILREAGGNELTPDEINPVWLQTPAAPFVAARREERTIDTGAILRRFRTLRENRRSVLIEGAGGWLVPIARDYFVADLAADMGLPVVIVVRNRLGALNHALLTLENIRQRGLQCAGFILNNMAVDESVATSANRGTLEAITDTPILFEVGEGHAALDLGVALSVVPIPTVMSGI